MSEQPETSKLPMIMTAFVSVIATVAVLHFYGYMNFARVEQQRDLESFTLSTVAEAGGSLRGTPADYLAECVDGVLVMHSRRHNGLNGVLSDPRGRVVRCEGQSVPVRD